MPPVGFITLTSCCDKKAEPHPHMKIVNCTLSKISFICSLPLLVLRYAIHMFFIYQHKDKSIIMAEANIQADDNQVFRRVSPAPLKQTLRLLWNLHCNPYFLAALYCRLRPSAAWLCGIFKRNYFPFYISPRNVGILHYHHPFSTIVNAKQVGNYVTVRQNTTIGNKGIETDEDSRPSIGNNVDIGANCIIFGDIRIGDNAIIGAGSLINKDVPDNAIAVGNPFRIIGYVGSGNTSAT